MTISVSFIKNRMPASMRNQLRTLYRRAKLYSAKGIDRRRYALHSTTLHKAETKEQKRGSLTFNYHKLEKGLALPEPRPGFAKATALGLIKELKEYETEFGRDDMSEIVVSVLTEYHNANANHGIVFSELAAFLEDDGRLIVSDIEAGSVSINKGDLFPVSTEMANQFLLSRRSVRQFTGAPVSQSDIEAAITVAQRAPSVCNRQSGRVFWSNEPEKIEGILAHQNGNRGFGHMLGAVLVVTSELAKFRDVGERNQPYVDGGIFAMAVAFALHARGIGSCMLNWSVEPKVDAALRAEFGLPENHIVITMIGCGHAKDTLRVAASPRDHTTDVLKRL